MDYLLRNYLPIFITVFLLLVFIMPTIRIYRQTGINPFRFARTSNAAHDYIGASMKLFILMLVLMVFVYSLAPSFYAYSAPFLYFQNGSIQMVGLVLSHLSIVGIMIAQHQMRESWRIGIDYENKTRLVTTGLFARSRNPIFLFLLISLIGLFLTLPNAVSFAVLFAAYLVLHITMRLEEAFLMEQHGEAYRQYCQKVRRLL